MAKAVDGSVKAMHEKAGSTIAGGLGLWLLFVNLS
jgi:hypothetical protein